MTMNSTRGVRICAPLEPQSRGMFRIPLQTSSIVASSELEAISPLTTFPLNQSIECPAAPA
jgi:hypothetical protein